MLTAHAPFQADSIHGIMYQILNSTPPAPSQRDSALPEIVDLIVAKALTKSVEERYQSAKDLATDLQDCKEMLQGRASAPGKFSLDKPGPPPAPTATRRQDKVVKIKSPNAKAADSVTERPGLMLAKAFDSYEATMRLAAMTGMDKELASFADTAPAHSSATSDAGGATTATWQKPTGTDPNRDAPADRGSSYILLWIASIAALLAAVALFIFR
jgi:serine/threonine-protein kinase